MTQDQALSILKTGANVFLTGGPGSGKTYTINQYIAYLRQQGIQPAITASTGIAATHIGGVTVHSWSGIGIKAKLEKRDLGKIAATRYIVDHVKPAKVLIIEEVSMLSPQTLLMIDAVCREIKQNPEPFGGIQVIFVGDFFQLPPVVRREDFDPENTARFAYDSPSWEQTNPTVCYLTEQHRQDDSDFSTLLSAIRDNTFVDDHLQHLQNRKVDPQTAPEGTPKLFSHNVDVDRVNDAVLEKLSGEPHLFSMSSQGANPLIEALKRGCLSPANLTLKLGSAVMFTKNNPLQGVVNGTLGEVVSFSKVNGYPLVETRSKRKIEVKPADWSIEENSKVLAQISQLPLRLAWAITVHKSQGMSLDAAVMDLSSVFEYGQGYVALSRVRSLAGLYILGWNQRTFQVHPEVLLRDEVFRQSSGTTNRIFSNLSSMEIGDRHKAFVLANGGKEESTEKDDDTCTKTLALWDQGKTLKKIAKARNLKEGTILDHLEHLVGRGDITSTDISRIIPASLSPDLPKIRKAFVSSGDDKLSPVFQKLKGKYSYDQLRLARMVLSLSSSQ